MVIPGTLPDLRSKSTVRSRGLTDEPQHMELRTQDSRFENRAQHTAFDGVEDVPSFDLVASSIREAYECTPYWSNTCKVLVC